MSFESHVINFPANRDGEIAQRWNHLWSRSDAQLPTARWEHLKLWFDTFAPAAKRQALIVEHSGDWIAAIPLVGNRLKGVIPIWEIPYSCWTPSPEFMIVRDFATERAVYDQLFAGLRHIGRPLFRVSEMSRNNGVGDEFLAAASRAGCLTDVGLRFEIGQIEIQGGSAAANFKTFQAQRSRNFRRNIGKMLRRAESLGGVELNVERPRDPQDVEYWMSIGLAIENRGWKGANGSSAMSVPGMVQYYTRQAQLQADQNELTLLFLKHQGAPIAFEYGWTVNRTYFSPKVGYDENYSHLSPGHLLMYLWIERMFDSDEYDTYDFAGPVADATSNWITRKYAVSRVVGSTGLLGNQILRGGQWAGACADRVKHKIQEWRKRLAAMRAPAIIRPATENDCCAPSDK
jgi:hypothetical protein